MPWRFAVAMTLPLVAASSTDGALLFPVPMPTPYIGLVAHSRSPAPLLASMPNQRDGRLDRHSPSNKAPSAEGYQNARVAKVRVLRTSRAAARSANCRSGRTRSSLLGQPLAVQIQDRHQFSKLDHRHRHRLSPTPIGGHDRPQVESPMLRGAPRSIGPGHQPENFRRPLSGRIQRPATRSARFTRWMTVMSRSMRDATGGPMSEFTRALRVRHRRRDGSQAV